MGTQIPVLAVRLLRKQSPPRFTFVIYKNKNNSSLSALPALRKAVRKLKHHANPMMVLARFGEPQLYFLPGLGARSPANYKDIDYLSGERTRVPQFLIYLFFVDIPLLLFLTSLFWHVFDFVQKLSLGSRHTVVCRAVDQHTNHFLVFTPGP
jgi:hypothetical protein